MRQRSSLAPFRLGSRGGGNSGFGLYSAAADSFGLSLVVGGSAVGIGGAKVARVQNANGVVLELHGAQVGLELSLNIGGATITMQ
jgi:hypothetical protein